MQEPNNVTPTLSSITVINRGDLFTSGMQTIVNPINCKGAMGRGLALVFKTKYPLMYKDYQNRCKKGLITLGHPYLWRETPNSPECILNFPTKGHWKNDSKLEDIQKGLQHLARNVQAWGITSLAIPALGCGLGGLSWESVFPEIETYLGPLNIPIQVYKEGPVLESVKKTKGTQHAAKSEQPSKLSETFFSKKRKLDSSVKASSNEENKLAAINSPSPNEEKVATDIPSKGLGID